MFLASFTLAAIIAVLLVIGVRLLEWLGSEDAQQWRRIKQWQRERIQLNPALRRRA